MENKTKRTILFKQWIAFILTFVIVVVTIPCSAVAEQQPEKIRYSVLLLDGSGSMEGTPKQVQISAAVKFCKSILADAETNYVAVVSFNSDIEVLCDFSSDLEILTEAINDINADGGTNIQGALSQADKLLNSINVPDTAIKNIILCSDGIPESGETTTDGPYTKEDYTEYQYANATYSYAEKIRDLYNIYTLGFFHALEEKEFVFARRFMMDIVGDYTRYYEVTDVNKLEFTFGELVQNIVENTKENSNFYYASGNEMDFTAEFFYDDEYFTNSSYDLQDAFNSDTDTKLHQTACSLATMSMCLAFSAFGSNRVPNTTEGYQEKSQNLKYLLSLCGFKEEYFETNYYYKIKPQMDSIGVGACHKQISDHGEAYTLIAVGVRGGGYESEWSSNFTIGESGQHQGFNKAKEEVLSFLSSYINSQNIRGNIKLWIAGYSRAAATTNLVAGEIDSGYDLSSQVNLRRQDLYAYCFEAPQGALLQNDVKNNIYNNITNIINQGDIVTKVAPTQPLAFGFSRYGVDHYLPTKLTYQDDYRELQKKMLEKYNALSSTDRYIVDDFQMKKISILNIIWDVMTQAKKNIIVDDTDDKWDQNAFLDEFLRLIFSENMKNRNNYVAIYQNDIREICKVVFGTPTDIWNKFPNVFMDELKQDLFSIAYALTEKSITELVSIIEEDAVNALNKLGITDYNKADINTFAEKIAKLLLSIGLRHPNYTVTFVSNIKGIGTAHYPELCLSWLQSYDKNYTPEGRAVFTSGVYRVLHINCPVDVVVYQKGKLVASIINDRSQLIDNSSIVTCINENDEKLVYLPASSDYKVELKASDDGFMTYSIDEHSEAVGGITRITNFYNVLLVKGETLMSHVPAITRTELQTGLANGSNTSYTLYDSNNNYIEPSDTKKGIDAQIANYLVEVSTSQEACYVAGGGYIVSGNYAKLIAVAANGYQFEGWYENGTLLSQDKEYRFCVTADHSIIGIFRESLPEHTHSPVLQNVKEATCITEGYSGDIICSECQMVLTEGIVIAAKEHNPVLQNVKEATCIAEGYSGDTICSECKMVLAKGIVTATKGHIYDQGVCVVCGKQKLVALSKTVITLKTKSNGVLVKWKTVKGASKYIICRKIGNGKYKTIQISSRKKYLDKQVKNGKSYTYKVYVVNGNHKSKASKEKKKLFLKAAKKMNVQARNKKVIIKVKKNSKADGYQIQYAKNKKFKNAKTVTIKGNKRKALKSLKKKKYFIRIRYYKKFNAKKYYSVWTFVLSIRI